MKNTATNNLSLTSRATHLPTHAPIYQAAEIFEEAQEGGKGFCGTYPEEEAELYVEQFTRCEPIIYADMEKEGVRKGAEAGAGA